MDMKKEAIETAKERVSIFNQVGERKLEAEALLGMVNMYAKIDVNRAMVLAGTAMDIYVGLSDKEGMQACKAAMDNGKHELVSQEIWKVIEEQQGYLHVPEGL